MAKVVLKVLLSFLTNQRRKENCHNFLPIKSTKMIKIKSFKDCHINYFTFLILMMITTNKKTIALYLHSLINQFQFQAKRFTQ